MPQRPRDTGARRANGSRPLHARWLHQAAPRLLRAVPLERAAAGRGLTKPAAGSHRSLVAGRLRKQRSQTERQTARRRQRPARASLEPADCKQSARASPRPRPSARPDARCGAAPPAPAVGGPLSVAAPRPAAAPLAHLGRAASDNSVRRTLRRYHQLLAPGASRKTPAPPAVCRTRRRGGGPPAGGRRWRLCAALGARFPASACARGAVAPSRPPAAAAKTSAAQRASSPGPASPHEDFGCEFLQTMLAERCIRSLRFQSSPAGEPARATVFWPTKPRLARTRHRRLSCLMTTRHLSSQFAASTSALRVQRLVRRGLQRRQVALRHRSTPRSAHPATPGSCATIRAHAQAVETKDLVKLPQCLPRARTLSS